jgi:hypothetical protein
MATDLLIHSALYRELSELPDADSQTTDLIQNRIIQQLGSHGVCKDTVLRFTRSMINGYIHPALKSTTVTELTAAKELIEFWQFPIQWSNAVDEEIAFRTYLKDPTVLPPILTVAARRIRDAYACRCGVTEIDVEMTDIFSSRKTRQIDAIFGRRRLNSNSFSVEKTQHILSIAVANGDLDVLQLFVDTSFSLQTHPYLGVALAAKQRSTFDWLLEHGAHKDAVCAIVACEQGDVELLHHLIDLEFPFVEQANSIPVALSRAAAKGHLTVLKEVRTICQTPWTFDYLAAAIKHGHTEIVEWSLSLVTDNVSRTEFFQTAMNNAAAVGDLELVQWLHSREARTHVDETAVTSATTGTIACLKWLIDTGYPVTERVGVAAVNANRIDIVEWLVENGHIQNTMRLYGGLSRIATIEMVRWLVAQRYPISREFYGMCKVLFHTNKAIIAELDLLHKEGLVIA